MLCSWVIAIFKECLIKSKKSHCLLLISCILNPENCFRSGKRFQVLRYLFHIFRLNNTIYMYIYNFSFNGKHYVQTEGTAIGSHSGMNYASVYLGSWEKNIVWKFKDKAHDLFYIRRRCMGFMEWWFRFT
jgi:hypothetical protein